VTVTASPMTPGWHAERTPDAPAIVMGSSGQTVTYAELDDLLRLGVIARRQNSVM
jgi:long-chain acyl-CoA synthetase